ncbi:MAG: hypothetical protein B6D44_08890 [Ignavibacteriales bacterium UTCHB2]|jgi:hypothetical protein|nr:MAG: putative addiction module component [Ignavibacteria bacterium ADurb.Bin266]OQY72898.1 MAG: hypothetical protein B6D44_08890 [Ignavibacteriales bacterium UTCHB2]HQI40349.1 addiction module protein [Ignavibacteriaceae bacterium]
MSELVKKLCEEVALLPREDRIELIEKLLQSLNTPGLEEIDQLWMEEAEKRIGQLESGEMNLQDGIKVFKELKDRLNN